MIELRRGTSKLVINQTIWTMTIELARLCGWVPIGPRSLETARGLPDVLADVRHLVPWQIEYIAGDGQSVLATDAAAMAQAFDRAVTEGDQLLARWNAGEIDPPAGLRTPASGFKWFTNPEGKRHLKVAADFCRQGEFQIF